MSGFTPGPWTVQDGTTTGKVVLALGEPKVRRSVAACGGQRRDANARLIAAAPDLLESLRDFIEPYEHTDNVALFERVGAPLAQQIFAARCAIAKAEGRS